MNTGKLDEQNELICRPIDTYEDIILFLQNPPLWRSLCTELKTHSKYAIRNKDINISDHEWEDRPDNPQSFCHIQSETETVVRQELKKLPKTLVCHDMANGYHDDSFVDGTGRHDAYTFYQWGGVDIFCYFSHHLLTIPPLGWINVGHAHGVQVIGTVITEWESGRALWERVLSSELKWKEFASMLVAVAKLFKFDGWLLNIENEVSRAGELVRFVRYLHQELHQELPTAVLLWYDSVTVHGTLRWQNELNEHNEAFFAACDGLFTNYAWSERQVVGSAQRAADRAIDLFVGIDVWGRNFFGGGQFNTQAAVKIAHKYGCSLAIFAPAWSHEAIPDGAGCCSPGGQHQLDKGQQFALRERALWGSLWPYLNTRLPSELPFQTSFCRGQGKKRRLYGEVLCPVPWYNLRHMQYQPNSNHGAHGYLLSTIAEIVTISRQQIRTEDNGNVKYRNQFIARRAQTLSGDNTSELSGEEIPSDSKELSSNVSEYGAVRKSIRDVFNYFSRLKPSKSVAETTIVDPVLEVIQNTVVCLSWNLNIGAKTNPNGLALAHVPGERECLEVYLDDSFIGGSCLRINPSDDFSSDQRLIRLFHCDFSIKDTLIACIVTKTLPGFEDAYLNLQLVIINTDGQEKVYQLCGRNGELETEDKQNTDSLQIYPINTTPNEEFTELQKYLLLSQPGFYVPIENAFSWNVRYWCVKGARGVLTEVRSWARGPLLLGSVGLCPWAQVTSHLTPR